MLDKTKDLLKNAISRASLLFKEKKVFKYFKYSGDFSLFNLALKTYSNQYSHKQQHPPVLNFPAFLWRAPDKLSSQHLSYSLTSVGEKFPLKTRKKKKQPKRHYFTLVAPGHLEKKLKAKEKHLSSCITLKHFSCDVWKAKSKT